MGDWGLSAKLQQDAEEVYIMLAALDTSDSVLRRREFAKALSGRDIDHKELFAAMDPDDTGMVMWGQWMQHISDAHNEREAECAAARRCSTDGGKESGLGAPGGRVKSTCAANVVVDHLPCHVAAIRTGLAGEAWDSHTGHCGSCGLSN